MPAPSTHPRDPLHGVTLENILTQLQAQYGWDELARRIPVRCFMFDPTIRSSLKFLRQTPWARKKIEDWFANDQLHRQIKQQSRPVEKSRDTAAGGCRPEYSQRTQKNGITIMTFQELALPGNLIAALEKQKITAPMPSQAAAFPVILEGKDVSLCSETGSGKTLAYLLPVFCRLNVTLPATQVIVIAPTHELAIQIQRQCTDLAQNAGMAVRALLLIGGTSMERQIDKLKKKPQIVVGSSGRIRELISLGKLKVNSIKTVIIDEADRLLGDENLESVRKVILATPAKRQLVFVSATEKPESAREIQSLAPDLVTIQTAAVPVNKNIEHLYLVCEERDKPDLLRKLIHATAPQKAIVFVHRNQTAEIIASKLDHHHVTVADLHGAYDKMDRKKAMDDFRSGKVQVLIASDVAARGLDIPGVTHIFNVDAPSQSKDYLHRVGRTARAGASGVAVSLLTEPETRLVRRYHSDLGITLSPIRLREGRVEKLTTTATDK